MNGVFTILYYFFIEVKSQLYVILTVNKDQWNYLIMLRKYCGFWTHFDVKYTKHCE